MDAAQFPDLLRRPWIGVINRQGLGQQRAPKGDRVPERMEKGQDAKHAIAVTEIGIVQERFHVGRDVGLSEHDTLGLAGRAARKDHGGEVGRFVVGDTEQPFQYATRQDHSRQERSPALKAGNGRPRVFSLDQFDVRPQFKRDPLRETLGRQNVAQAALPSRRADILRSRGVIQIDDRFAKQGQRDVGDDRPGTLRQPNAHHLVAYEFRPKPSGEAHRPREYHGTIQPPRLRPGGVDQALPEGMSRRQRHELPMQRQNRTRTLLGPFRQHCADGLPERWGGDAGRLSGTKSYRHRILAGHRPLPEQPAALVRKNAAPKLIEANWDDRCRAFSREHLDPAVKRQHHPGTRGKTLGEKTHDVTIAQRRENLVE